MWREHFEILASVLGLLIALHNFNVRRFKRLERKIERLLLYEVEHEILVDFYCDMTGKSRNDLPTRHTRVQVGNGDRL